MSKDSQDLEILQADTTLKPRLKKQPQPKIEQNENQQEENIFLKMQEEINRLKSHLEDIDDFKQKVNKLTAPKQKKEKSDLQKRAFEKCRATAHHNAQLRLQEKAKLAEQMTKDYEEKVLKKAIAIKKREIKTKAKLEAISDDDTPMEEIKKISNKLDNKQQPSEPKKESKFKFI